MLARAAAVAAGQLFDKTIITIQLFIVNTTIATMQILMPQIRVRKPFAGECCKQAVLLHLQLITLSA